MAFNLTAAWVIAALSWLGSAFLAVRLWRSSDLLAIKVGLTLLLVVPVVGPFFYFWIWTFPDENLPELKEDIHYADRTWRQRLERAGMLPPLVQHWTKRRRK